MFFLLIITILYFLCEIFESLCILIEAMKQHAELVI